MISGGSGLMDTIFNYTAQPATYGLLQSEFWRVVLLDSAYHCYELNADGTRRLVRLADGSYLPETDAPQPDAVVEWLANVARIGDANDKRGLVLMTHHQPLSNWQQAYGGTLRQLERLLGAQGRQVIWFFGHEHRLAIYKETTLNQSTFQIFPRMIGNGGFADYEVSESPDSLSELIAFDGRVYQNISNDAKLIPHVPDSSPIGFNGYASLSLVGPELRVQYKSVQCVDGDCERGISAVNATTVLSETFLVSLVSGEISNTIEYIGSELTVPARP